MHYHRREREQTIVCLSDKYPGTFYVNGALRRPLKKGIINDLIDDNDDLAKDLLAQALSFYEQDFAYLRAVLVGAERFDLEGKVVGKVTLSEQQAARRSMTEQKLRLAATHEATARLAVVPAANPGVKAVKRTPVLPPPPAAEPPPSPPVSDASARALQLLADLTAALDCIRPVLGDNSFAPLRKVLVGAALKDVAAKVEALATEVAS